MCAGLALRVALEEFVLDTKPFAAYWQARCGLAVLVDYFPRFVARRTHERTRTKDSGALHLIDLTADAPLQQTQPPNRCSRGEAPQAADEPHEQGATAAHAWELPPRVHEGVVQRLCLRHGWREDFVRPWAEEMQRFLALKADARDTDALMLSPSGAVPLHPFSVSPEACRVSDLFVVSLASRPAWLPRMQATSTKRGTSSCWTREPTGSTASVSVCRLSTTIPMVARRRAARRATARRCSGTASFSGPSRRRSAGTVRKMRLRWRPCVRHDGRPAWQHACSCVQLHALASSITQRFVWCRVCSGDRA